MKKINVLLLATSFFTFSVISCNNYKSIHSATKVSEIKGNPFMYNVAKSVIKNVANYAEKNNISTPGKINLLTPISSIFTTEEHIAGLKDLLVLSYKIPVNKINAGFSKISLMKDLITFVAKNGRGFNFYSTNTSL